jgi:hypothetical protein
MIDFSSGGVVLYNVLKKASWKSVDGKLFIFIL